MSARQQHAGGIPPAPQRKQVVTAFIQRPDGKVLLVLRSGKVGSYQEQYGGVSGGIEGEEAPAARCLQEIEEEVGLQASQISLVRSGRPLLVDDAQHGFGVHPFLFSLPDPSAAEAVRLNWENVGSRWLDPGEIRRLNTVPQLAETYERLALSPSQLAAVQALAEDRQHGAAQLALWVLDALQAEAGRQCGGEGSCATADGLGLLTALRNFGYHLAVARPSMAAPANAAAAVLAAVHADLLSRADAFPPSAAEVCGVAAAAVAAQRLRLHEAGAAVRRGVRALLRDGTTLLTTSFSSTILEAVLEAAAAGLRLKAIVTEARPLCEGVRLAEAWAAAGIDVVLITDAQAGLFVGQADLVVVGADAVTPAAVVNKAGTYLLALAASAKGVPLYAAADTSKLSPGSLERLAHPGGSSSGMGGEEEEALEEKGSEELVGCWPGGAAPAGVRVRNVYFEPTPLALFEGVVTERGILAVPDIQAAAEAQRQQYFTAFHLEPPDEPA